MVELKYHGDMRTLTKKDSEKCEAENIKDVFSYLKITYGSSCAKEAKKMLIALNGTSIELKEGFKTHLSDGDSVSFLPVCGGG